MLYETKKYDEALAQLQDVLRLEPNHVEALYYLGVVFNAKQLYPQAIVALDRAHALAPAELPITYQLGIAHFGLQDYDKAEPLLTEVFTAKPQLDNLGYYVGFIRYRHKDYKGAVEAFRAGRATDLQIQQLSKFYSGLAFAIMGLPDQATVELAEASRIRTVSPLTAPADRLRDTLVVSQERERRFHVELHAGAYYDSNVPINPIAGGINPATPDGQLVYQLRSRKANSPGELLSARGEYAFFRESGWEATVLGSYFKTFNNDLSFFNIENYLGGLGTSYQGAVAQLPFLVSAQYTYDYTTLSGSRFLNRQSTTLVGTLVENSWNLTSIQARLQAKDFSEAFLIGGGTNQAENRDANNWMIGFTHVFRFANDKHFIRFGYQYDVDDAKGEDWFYRGQRFLAGTQYTLPWWDMRLKYDFDFHYRKYPNVNLVFPPSAPGTVMQEVQEQNHIFRIEQPLPSRFTLSADFQATISRDNLPFIFNYNRYVGTLTLAWGF